jgi:hypothetical protein
MKAKILHPYDMSKQSGKPMGQWMTIEKITKDKVYFVPQGWAYLWDIEIRKEKTLER